MSYMKGTATLGLSTATSLINGSLILNWTGPRRYESRVLLAQRPISQGTISGETMSLDHQPLPV